MPTPEQLTIPDKLDSLNVTKQAIREAIVAKGVDVQEGTTFYEYAGLINGIETGGGTVSVTITHNGSSKSPVYVSYCSSNDSGKTFEPVYELNPTSGSVVNVPVNSSVVLTTNSYLSGTLSVSNQDINKTTRFAFSGAAVSFVVCAEDCSIDYSYA